MVEYSLVVPVFDEVTALPHLAIEIRDVMQRLDAGWECILVDDGSRDGSAQVIDDLCRTDGSAFRAVHFPSNRGQAAALDAGLRQAAGAVIVILDGDGQSCPADIPRLIRTLRRDDLDLVCGVRVDRRDGWGRRAMSRLANAIRARVLHDHTSDAGCALKAMRREVVTALVPLRTLYSFIPALAVAAGFRVGECPVAHRPRHGGHSSYGLRVFLWWPLVDMVGVRWLQSRSVRQRSDVVDDRLNDPSPAASLPRVHVAGARH
jgi:glycosyltransferase involved in cell wall biosynthesis